jgi:hypothetical protein
LKNLLNSILEKQETMLDNSFSEGALQGTLEAALRAQNEYNVSFEMMKAEEEFPNSLNPNKPFRTDLTLETSQDVIIIELKRVRPNAIEKHVYWGTMDYRQLKEELNKPEVKEIDLLNKKIQENSEFYNNAKTVGEVLEKTKEQARKYPQLMKTKL